MEHGAQMASLKA